MHSRSAYRRPQTGSRRTSWPEANLMTEPIKPPKISYDIVSDVWDNSDVFRFFDECTSAIFDEMDHIFDDCEVTAGFVRQMLIEKAAKYQIRRRGRPHGSRTKIP